MTETGIWTESEKDFHAFDYYLAKFIGQNLNKHKNLFDFGCGKGTYLDYFNDIGFENLIGVDGFKLSNYEYDNIHIHDLTTPLDLGRKGNVISLEVWEHIPQEFEGVFIDNLTRHLDGTLVISVAVPGQEGTGHVNCQSNEYVIEQLEMKGCSYDYRLTFAARQNVSNHCAYFRNTLMVFNK